jgi:hypothetical protein
MNSLQHFRPCIAAVWTRHFSALLSSVSSGGNERNATNPASELVQAALRRARTASSGAGDRLHGMRVTDVQREALKLVVQRFVNTKEATPRIHLVKQLKDPDLVDDLVPVILRNPIGDQLFPTALAFECCGDPEALLIARKSVEAVIHVLRRLFEIHLEKMDFTIGEVEQQARIMFLALEPMTVTLGLYLVQDFSGIHAGIGGMWPNITFVRIHEKIGLLQNVADAWNEHVNKYSLYLVLCPLNN